MTRATSRWSRPAAPARCTSSAIARELYIPRVIVPLFPSHFSALGMLLADERHDFIRTYYGDLAGIDFAELVEGSRRDGDATPDRRCATPRNAQRQIQLDLRYVGQEFALQVPVTLDQLKKGERKAIRDRVRCAVSASLCASFAGRAGGDGEHPPRRYRAAAAAEVPER